MTKRIINIALVIMTLYLTYRWYTLQQKINNMQCHKSNKEMENIK